MLRASCHCGDVQIEIARKPKSFTQCTCSICRRYGALWAYCTRKSAHVLSASDVETSYRWNDEVIEFFHCNRCGCMTRYENVEKSAAGRIAVNARMLAPGDVDGIEIRTFDGADSCKYID